MQTNLRKILQHKKYLLFAMKGQFVFFFLSILFCSTQIPDKHVCKKYTQERKMIDHM